jgi:hypothetical protein
MTQNQDLDKDKKYDLVDNQVVERREGAMEIE